MSKKSPIRSSRQATAQQPMRLKKITELMLATAVLSVAAVSVQAQTANAVLVDSDTSFGSLNGALSSGGQAAGFVITGGASVSVGNNTSQSLVSNFNTIGGAGSGGGAALGGAFFVDSGSTLTVLNTNFSSNRAQGGTGGGAAPVSFVDQLLNITGASQNLAALPVATVGFVEVGGLPAITRNNNGTYSFSQLTVSNDTASLLKPGYVASFNNYGSSAAISGINSGTIQLSSPVVVQPRSLSTYAATSTTSSLDTYNSTVKSIYDQWKYDWNRGYGYNLVYPSAPAVSQSGQSGYTVPLAMV